MNVCIPRWIDVEGVKNFRDIGGWPIKDGSGYVRERTVFRSAQLGGITKNGIQTLRHLGITGVFDFRSDIELKDQSMRMPEISGITHYQCPMFKDEDFAPEKKEENLLNFFQGPEGVFKGYRDMLVKAKDQYRKIFLYILEHPDDAIIVHCRMGKDRTGLFFALLLGICGVDDDIIANEFAMTTIGAWEPKKTLEVWAQHLGITFDQAKEGLSAS
ncbi:tyrosine phosphatase family-domain-containing protein [Phascolomyces articulosus]|uniref:Tyrosine phosphatase family-domain-containing protein n=1 Tax=Phascolomyces articulosus TaxID=60185 RepID=A0AAD5PFU6_9FUNG|nr:tyrosine phosphatase family-domain-containing protein [Phascolomyces articulosus]